MKKIATITIGAVIITILFFYLGVFSPLKNESENSLEHNFLNKVSINEVSIENRFDRYKEGSKSLSSRTMIKNKLIEYNNQEISLAELKEYTQSKYVDGVKALDNIIAAYRITDNDIVADYGNLNLGEIQSNYSHSSDELEVILTNEKNSVIINSPIINDSGDKIGNDIVVFDISGFMESVNQNDIQYEIIQSETALNPPLDQGGHVVDYRKILDTNYWLRASESKANLYESLNSIITKIVIIFVILLIGFSVVFYKTISNAFNNIISELEKKIKKLNDNKKSLENLTDQVPGALYQFQSKKDGSYFLPYSSKGLEPLFGFRQMEAKVDADKIFSKIHEDDFDYFIKSIEESKNNLTPWQNIFRIGLSPNEMD